LSSNKKEVKSKKIVKLILFNLFFFFIILFVVSAINILNYIKDSKENEKVFDEIAEDIEIQEIPNHSMEDNNYIIDFESLSQKNSDVVGFLKVNGTDIEQVVVKSKDNNYYLSHNFEKQQNSAGWIFVDYRNNLDGTDKNIIIYGHNMKNGTMFSSLKNVLNSEWKENEENRYITFITERENVIYEVFSVYQMENEDYYIKTNFKGKEFNTFINTMKNRSKYKFNVDVSDNDEILTLSTCGNNNNYRIILHAKKIIQ